MNQMSFDPLDYVDTYAKSGVQLSIEQAQKIALSVRNAELRRLRKGGAVVKGWTLTGQLRKYASFGVPDGSVRNVYYINVNSQP